MSAIYWTDEHDKRLMELRKNHSQKETARLLTKEFKRTFTRNGVKNREARLTHKDEWKQDEPLNYKDTVEILSDGSHKSDKLLRMDANQCKDVNFLLQAHGYDIDKWELVSARNNIWNTYSKQDGIQTLYSSKITVKPKGNKTTEQDILNAIDKLQTIKIPKAISIPAEDAPYINLPLFDMHFGISDYEYYKPTQEKILHFLDKPRKDVLFIIGQDLFHNNDMQGHTASGREIQKVDMEKAFEDAWMFYVPLIEKAIKNSEQVHLYYSIGNHDEYSGWSFAKSLEKTYQGQVIFDTRFKERKVHMLGNNFVGMNHSDKKKMKNLPENFSTEFPMEWARATTREIYVGHEHKEDVIILVTDSGGVVLRRMPTGNKVDDWHDSMGYTTAHKRFQIFEYSEDKLESIHYV